MGDNAVEKLVALAGTVRVSGYTRQSSTGKTVRVSAYTRSPGDMTNIDIASEMRDLVGLNPDYDPTDDDLTDAQARSRLAMLQREVAARKRAKMWNPTSPAKPYDKDSTPSGDGFNIESRRPTKAALRDAVAESPGEMDLGAVPGPPLPSLFDKDRLSSGKDAEDTSQDALDARNRVNHDDVTQDQLSSLGKGPAKATFPTTKAALDHLAEELKEQGGPRGAWADHSELAKFRRNYPNLNGLTDIGITRALNDRGIKINNVPGAPETKPDPAKTPASRPWLDKKPAASQITADAFDKIVNQRLRDEDGGYTPAGVEFTAEDGTKVRVKHRQANLNDTWGALEGGISVKRGGEEKYFSYSETPYGQKNGHRDYETAKKAALDFANGKGGEDKAALSGDHVESYIALSREI